MSDARELELKLEVGPRQLARLKTRALKPLGEPRARQRLGSVYFDTPDHRLRERGSACACGRSTGDMCRP
jgi:inorganic triphosphatase YgiF